jgi:hypothetical protein
LVDTESIVVGIEFRFELLAFRELHRFPERLIGRVGNDKVAIYASWRDERDVVCGLLVEFR